MRRLVAFDLDGTLAESKQAIDPDMAALLGQLTGLFTVAVISGGDWPQFETQLIGQLAPGTDLAKLILLPTSGTKLYRHDDTWQQVYAEALTAAERARIVAALDQAITLLDLGTARSWGERIEDRTTQITFSALGQQAPLAAKAAWDPDRTKRRQIQAMLAPELPDFAVRIGGSTSLDITRQGVDKGTGLTKLAQASGIPLGEMMFIGDALFPGGNDHAVIAAGVAAIAVRDLAETRAIIAALVLCRT